MNPASPSVPTSANGSEATELPILRVCGRCGATSSARFCGECGAPLDEELPGLRGLLREGAEVVGFDARLANTVRDLLLHPVRITRAYMARDAARYVPPLRIFFALASIYVALLALSQPFDTGTQISNALAGTSSMRALEPILQRHELTMNTLWMRYEGRYNALFPLIAALSVPVFAGVVWTMERGRTMVEHLLFAVGLSNVTWAVGFLVLPIAFWSNGAHFAAISVVSVAYSLSLYYLVYRRPSRLGTAVRAVAFTLVGTLASIVITLALMVGIFLSVFVF